MLESSSWGPVLDVVTGDLYRLSSVWRYNSIPVCNEENDMEHLGWVCIYSLIIHTHLRPEADLFVGAIATHAISHDITESVSGDIVRTFKYSSKALKKAINDAEEQIVSNFPDVIRKVLKLHHVQLRAIGAEKEIPYVETVVKMADFLSLWMFFRREIRRGNREIFPYYDIMIKDLQEMRQKFETETLPTYPSRPIIEYYRTLANQAMITRQECDSSYLVKLDQ